MKTPPLLLGATLLFWGWQTGLLIWALPMAVLLEAPNLTSRRWNFDSGDFNRIADLSTVLFLVVIAYQFAASRFPQGLFVIMQLLPCVLLPLVLAQVWGVREKIDLSVLFVSLRKGAPYEGEEIGQINLTYPYFAACWIATGGANVRTPWFYAALCALGLSALWQFKPDRVGRAHWALLFLAAAALGYGGQAGLYSLQIRLEDMMFGWFFQNFRRAPDPYHARTAIGEIGELKLSGQVIMRVQARELPENLLLTQATYRSFSANAWSNQSLTWTPVPGDGINWKLAEEAPQSREIGIAAYLANGAGLLALPAGSFQIKNLPAREMESNPWDGVRVKEGPGLALFTTRFAPGGNNSGPPDEDDLRIPFGNEKAVRAIGRELGLQSKTKVEAVQAVAEFFAANFRYARAPGTQDRQGKSLNEFLLRDRSGHCEYFATATVLLLRQAGIPARYAKGYAVDEYSKLENAYVVRNRHAHSWALAFVDGAWREVDNTPAVWEAEEAREQSSLQPLFDLGAWLSYRFSRWRWGQDEGSGARWVTWIALPLLFYFVWRLFRGANITGASAAGARPPADVDTAPEFHKVVKTLEAQGFARSREETLSRWLARVNRVRGDTSGLLESLLALHYRLRFDPAGLPRRERGELLAGVRRWLERAPGGAGRA